MFGPYITQLVEARDTGRLQRYLATCTRLMVIVAAPLLVLLSVIGGPTLHLLHQEAGSGQEALIILCGAFLVQAATGPVGQVLTMSGRSMLNFVDSSIAVAVNVACNLVLIPRLGLVGAALSWSIAVVGMNLARVFQVRSILGISPVSRTLLRPAIALAVAVAATLAARSTVLSLLPDLAAIAALVVGFAAVYLATLVGLGLYAEDRLLFRAILGRRANREVA
jgi:O-antigen/teichoic acid export membrane protein